MVQFFLGAGFTLLVFYFLVQTGWLLTREQVEGRLSRDLEGQVKRSEEILGRLNQQGDRLEELLARAEEAEGFFPAGYYPGKIPGKKEQISLPHGSQVLDMAEEGYGVSEIARKTGIGIGEVRLLLDLYRRDKSR